MISLRELVLKAYPGYPGASSLPEITIRGLACDSRRVEKDFMFVAIRGQKVDGRRFIQEATDRGAAAVVVDDDSAGGSRPVRVHVSECRLAASKFAAVFYGEPAKKLFVIGITGTNGKTTCSYLIEHLFQKENRKTGVIGTVNYRFDGKEVPAVETTPGPLRLQSILSEMLASRCTHVAMEVSSHALDQDRTAGIGFSQALFTNLTQDHLDYHGTMEAYFESKAKLFLGLSKEGVSVLNADDAWANRLPGRLSCRVMTYGIDADCDLKARDIAPRQDSTEFTLDFQGRHVRTHLPLMGRHNIYNALGALGISLASGCTLEKAAAGLRDFKGVPGRLESLDAGQNFSVLVDFAHTPDGLKNVLRALAPYKKRKLTVVFGCGGDRDRTKRPQMGQIAAECCDFVYLTSDNPRFEDPKVIAQEVQAGFPRGFDAFAVVLDRHKAIRRALMDAREGDIVLLAGKGHERTQVIGPNSIPFSDRAEAERILRGH